MRNRVIIENVQPEINCGQFFVKRVPGERVEVTADIFGDGHDAIRASLHYKKESAKKWEEVYMKSMPNDVWRAIFTPTEEGFYTYKVEGWVDHLSNWYKGFLKKHDAGQHLSVELQEGANFLEKTAEQYPKSKAKALQEIADVLKDPDKYQDAVNTVLSPEFAQVVHEYPMKQFQTVYDNKLRVRVGRLKELYSTWYEFFPRSAADLPGKHGTFKDAERLIPRIADMGFDVVYFPPIHPIGKKNRKGKNNTVNAKEGEPGSPWAIGSDEGGHKAIHPLLGTLEDYQEFIWKAGEYGLEIALDLAFQCAPDHPYLKEHPEWFIWRPDGSVAYAENPPKKYQDIVPINFETEDWENLWEELKSVVLYWVDKGVKIFRVDNPHTKPYRFWEWCIAEVHKKHPEVIFLSEAFTRPKVMAELAKVGFTQSYTYFTWRNNRAEMQEYMTELTKTELREFMRPNFWPNTPDILAYEMMNAGENQFVKRFLLAATLSSNYGMYGPAYEFIENTPNTNGKEEYFNSEKYEIRHYDWFQKNRLTEVITQVNQIRKENPALQDTYNIHFSNTDNEMLMSYIKLTDDFTNVIWCVASFDENNTQSGWVEVPRDVLHLTGPFSLELTDLLTEKTYEWKNDWNFVQLNPDEYPMHIFQVKFI